MLSMKDGEWRLWDAVDLNMAEIRYFWLVDECRQALFWEDHCSIQWYIHTLRWMQKNVCIGLGLR